MKLYLLASLLPIVFGLDRAAYGPHEGDVTFQSTKYELYTYSEPGFKGDAVRIEPVDCTNLARNNVAAPQSFRFRGNNCCFFFPTGNCDHLSAGQRIVGDVADTSSWGFPDIGAVKCFSHSACSVMRQHKCDFDPGCAQAAQQGQCPFVADCAAYHPVQARDFHNFTLEGTGFSPVRERFHVDADGTVSDRQLAPPPPPITPVSLDNKDGGLDDYDGTTSVVPVKPQATTKSEARRFRKLEKQREKALKKGVKDAKKAQKKKQRQRNKEEHKKKKAAKKAAKKAKQKAKATKTTKTTHS